MVIKTDPSKVQEYLYGTSAGQLALKMAAKDGPPDQISARQWNIFANKLGYKTITNYIDTKNAMNSIMTYALKESHKTGKDINKIVDSWNNEFGGDSPVINPPSTKVTEEIKTKAEEPVSSAKTEKPLKSEQEKNILLVDSNPPRKNISITRKSAWQSQIERLGIPSVIKPDHISGNFYFHNYGYGTIIAEYSDDNKLLSYTVQEFKVKRFYDSEKNLIKCIKFENGNNQQAEEKVEHTVYNADGNVSYYYKRINDKLIKFDSNGVETK